MNAFLETFFKPNLIAQYLPSILKGVVTTIEIALAVVVTGLGGGGGGGVGRGGPI